jgi:hypothetical protein
MGEKTTDNGAQTCTFAHKRSLHTRTCSEVAREELEDEEIASRPLLVEPFFFFFCGISRTLSVSIPFFT